MKVKTYHFALLHLNCRYYHHRSPCCAIWRGGTLWQIRTFRRSRLTTKTWLPCVVLVDLSKNISVYDRRKISKTRSSRSYSDPHPKSYRDPHLKYDLPVVRHRHVLRHSVKEGTWEEMGGHGREPGSTRHYKGPLLDYTQKESFNLWFLREKGKLILRVIVIKRKYELYLLLLFLIIHRKYLKIKDYCLIGIKQFIFRWKSRSTAVVPE